MNASGTLLKHATRPEELEALRPAWLELWQQDTRATAFMHPDWVLPWCRHFGRDRIEAFSVWRGNRLVGLAPMEIWPEENGRLLKLLGSGISDQLDVLTAPEYDAEVREALVAQFQQSAGSWDLCLLEPLGDQSLWAGDGRSRRIDVSPALELPSHVEELSSVVPPHLLSNVRAARRRLERTAPLRSATATPREVDGWMSALFELHRARWRQRGEGGVLEEPSVLAFHRDISRRLADAGVLRLHALFHGERLFAVLYAFAAHGRVHYYLSGFDPAYEKSSPGSLIVAAALEEAIARGDRVFDFLRGGEPYKYAWGARDRPLWQRVVEVRT
ncbi:MAG: GNAT family N-acetyltransferase [Myxococcaceae bacterium]